MDFMERLDGTARKDQEDPYNDEEDDNDAESYFDDEDDELMVVTVNSNGSTIVDGKKMKKPTNTTLSSDEEPVYLFPIQHVSMENSQHETFKEDFLQQRSNYSNGNNKPQTFEIDLDHLIHQADSNKRCSTSAPTSSPFEQHSFVSLVVPTNHNTAVIQKTCANTGNGESGNAFGRRSSSGSTATADLRQYKVDLEQILREHKDDDEYDDDDEVCSRSRGKEKEFQYEYTTLENVKNPQVKDMISNPTPSWSSNFWVQNHQGLWPPTATMSTVPPPQLTIEDNYHYDNDNNNDDLFLAEEEDKQVEAVGVFSVSHTPKTTSSASSVSSFYKSFYNSKTYHDDANIASIDDDSESPVEITRSRVATTTPYLNTEDSSSSSVSSQSSFFKSFYEGTTTNTHNYVQHYDDDNNIFAPLSSLSLPTTVSEDDTLGTIERFEDEPTIFTTGGANELETSSSRRSISSFPFSFHRTSSRNDTRVVPIYDEMNNTKENETEPLPNDEDPCLTERHFKMSRPSFPFSAHRGSSRADMLSTQNEMEIQKENEENDMLRDDDDGTLSERQQHKKSRPSFPFSIHRRSSCKDKVTAQNEIKNQNSVKNENEHENEPLPDDEAGNLSERQHKKCRPSLPFSLQRGSRRRNIPTEIERGYSIPFVMLTQNENKSSLQEEVRENGIDDLEAMYYLSTRTSSRRLSLDDVFDDENENDKNNNHAGSNKQCSKRFFIVTLIFVSCVCLALLVLLIVIPVTKKSKAVLHPKWVEPPPTTAPTNEVTTTQPTTSPTSAVTTPNDDENNYVYNATIPESITLIVEQDTYIQSGEKYSDESFGQEQTLLVQNGVGGDNSTAFSLLKFNISQLPPPWAIDDYKKKCTLILTIVPNWKLDIITSDATRPTTLILNRLPTTMTTLQDNFLDELQSGNWDPPQSDTIDGNEFEIPSDRTEVHVDCTNLLFEPGTIFIRNRELMSMTQVDQARREQREQESLMVLMLEDLETEQEENIRFFSLESEFPPRVEITLLGPEAFKHNKNLGDGKDSFICNLCGNDYQLTNPDATVTYLDETKTCREYQVDGLIGFVSETYCDDWSRLLSGPCGCTEIRITFNGFFWWSNTNKRRYPSCNLCGSDNSRQMTLPDAVISLPGHPDLTCGEYQKLFDDVTLDDYLVNPHQCDELSQFFSGPCGCEIIL